MDNSTYPQTLSIVCPQKNGRYTHQRIPLFSRRKRDFFKAIHISTLPIIITIIQYILLTINFMAAGKIVFGKRLANQPNRRRLPLQVRFAIFRARALKPTFSRTRACARKLLGKTRKRRKCENREKIFSDKRFLLAKTYGLWYNVRVRERLFGHCLTAA